MIDSASIPIIIRIAIVLGVAILLALILYAQRNAKKMKVQEIIPSWKNAEIIGDGAWDVPVRRPKSARVRDIEEARGF